MNGPESASDARLAGLALALGRRNRGLTWPNPSVGAVLATPGPAPRILAVGATQPGGRPHAERVALDAGGDLARGATLFVSLEPCAHHGRTPPCAEAVIAAGVARVVSPIGDADPRVAGLGFAKLRAAGVAVSVGGRAEEARRAHRGHFTRVRSARPFVSLKLARTPDGFAAGGGPGRLLITGEAANAATHLARARADALMVGIGTILADDPRLDVRLPGLEGRRPVRVVLDTALRLPLCSRVVRGAADQATWVLCGPQAGRDAELRLRDRAVLVLRSETDATGRLDLQEALRLLAWQGLTEILCEGGPGLAEALADADLVDEFVLLTGSAPLGAAGVPAVGPRLAARVGAHLRPAGERTLGPDTVTRFERHPCSPGS